MENSGVTLVYVTTPFCGVCQSARVVVEILATSLDVELSEINANLEKQEMQRLKITRVPALIVKKQEEVLQVFDTIDNLTEMYRKIIEVLEK